MVVSLRKWARLGARCSVLGALPLLGCSPPPAGGPAPAPVTERARDVKLPPPLPTLGRPPADRAGTDDPTTEAAHAAVTGPAVRVPPAPAGFLRVTLPDPFELAGQVRPRVPPAAEPGLTPVVVDPKRVK